MLKSGDYHLITELPYIGDLDPLILEDLFGVYCTGLASGDYIYTEEFIDTGEELQNRYLKELSYFIRDNYLISQITQPRFHQGTLRLNLKDRSAHVELRYHTLN